MNYLLSYCQAGLGDVLISTSFLKDFEQQRPDDKLFFQFKLQAMEKYYSVFDNNPYFHLYDEKTDKIDKEIHFGWGEQINLSELTMASSSSTQKYIDVLYDEFNRRSGLDIKCTQRKVDLYFSEEEKNIKYSWQDSSKKMCIVNCGYNYFYGNAKNWGWEKFQYVIDALKDKLQFVQVGMRKNGYFQRPLNGVVDLVDKTSIRDLATLTYHSDFVLTHDTSTYHFAMVDANEHQKERNVAVVLGGRGLYKYLDTYSPDRVNVFLLYNNEMFSKCFDAGKYTCDCADVFTTMAGRYGGGGPGMIKKLMCKMPSATMNGETICACFGRLHPDNVVEFFKKHI